MDPPDQTEFTSPDLPPFAREWLRQRRVGFRRMQELRDQELREMDSLQAGENLGLLDRSTSVEDPYACGLVRQQRWFLRARLLELLNEQQSAS